MENVEIRQKPDDISYEVVCDVVREAHEYVRQYGIIFNSTEFTGEKIKESLGEDGICYTALSDGNVGGTISVTFRERKKQRTADIRYVAVRPAFQGRGIGSAMLSHVLRELEQKNIWAVYLRTPANNKTAIRMYRKNGFIPMSCYYANHDVLRMGKWLGGRKTPLLYASRIYYLWTVLRTKLGKIGRAHQ